MSGTVNGGKRAAATNKRLYGDDFYHVIGRPGGLVQVPTKGFGSSSDRAKAAGRKGGQSSSSARKQSQARRCWELYGHNFAREEQSLLRLWYDQGLSMETVASKCGLSTEAARQQINRLNMRLYRYR